MALGSCRECGKQVAQDAPSCPHCGARDPAPTTTGKVKKEAASMLKWLAIGTVIAIIFFAWLNNR
jgi:uncharacterized membrane protein YvbJ